MRLTVLVCALAWALNSHAAPILLYSETVAGPGLWEYEYTVINNLDPIAQAGFDLYGVSFDFPVPPFVLLLPPGWDYVQIGSTVDAFSVVPGPLPAGSDVGPGQSLGGFVFTLDQQIGGVPFTYTFANPDDPGQPLLLSGTSTAIPEPSSAVLVISAIGISMLLRHRFARP